MFLDPLVNVSMDSAPSSALHAQQGSSTSVLLSTGREGDNSWGVQMVQIRFHFCSCRGRLVTTATQPMSSKATCS